MSMDNNEYVKIVRSGILKRDGYSCRRCGVRNKTRVYVNSRGKYVECDSFIEKWAQANNKKVFSVGLQVVKVDSSIDGYSPYNLITLCSKCLKTHNKLQKRNMNRDYKELIKKEAAYSYKRMTLEQMHQSAAVSKFIKEKTGVLLDASSLNQLINLVIKNK